MNEYEFSLAMLGLGIACTPFMLFLLRYIEDTFE